MNLVATPEQEELRRGLRRFLESASPVSAVRQLMESAAGYDPKVWAQMSAEMELQGLHIPEAYGGQGFSVAELALVVEEMGRALRCSPFFSSICLAGSAVLAAGTEEQKGDLLPGIAAGTTIATLALTEPNGIWNPADIAMTAVPDGSGAFRLDGPKTFVPDGHCADLIIVVARLQGSSGADGISLFAVNGDAPGLTRTSLATMDLTRRQARLDFVGARARPLGDLGEVGPALSAALDLAAVCLAAEQVGGAERCLEMAVEYAKLRAQFGRPIGSFQAIKHKCAGMLVWVDASKAAATYATAAAADGAADLPAAASIAQAYCSEAYVRTAAENIQIHGGIGFTWEHDAHLYYRRAKASEVLLGEPVLPSRTPGPVGYRPMTTERRLRFAGPFDERAGNELVQIATFMIGRGEQRRRPATVHVDLSGVTRLDDTAVLCLNYAWAVLAGAGWSMHIETPDQHSARRSFIEGAIRGELEWARGTSAPGPRATNRQVRGFSAG